MLKLILLFKNASYSMFLGLFKNVFAPVSDPPKVDSSKNVARYMSDPSKVVYFWRIRRGCNGIFEELEQRRSYYQVDTENYNLLYFCVVKDKIILTILFMKVRLIDF